MQIKLYYHMILPVVKKRTVECTAIDLYCNLVASIDFSVTSAVACLTWISLLNTFEEVKTLIASSSSSIFPSATDKTSNILSSVSFRSLKLNLYH